MPAFLFKEHFSFVGKRALEGAPTAGSAHGLPAGSTTGLDSSVRDFFVYGLTCPRVPAGHTAGLPAGGAPIGMPLAPK